MLVCVQILLVLKRTRLGLDIRAVSQNRAMANLFVGLEQASGSMTAIHATLDDVAYSPSGDRIASVSSTFCVDLICALRGSIRSPVLVLRDSQRIRNLISPKRIKSLRHTMNRALQQET